MRGSNLFSAEPLSYLPYLVPYRCSSGFDRYRQEWLAYGCAQEVRLVSDLL